MTATDDLFILIKSMTGAEKRYFRLFSSIYDRKKNYLKLFDGIDKQKEKYDEQKLIKDFKHEKWLSQFAKTKNQLYNAILISLNAYHRNADVHAQLSLCLEQIKILFEKNLFAQSKKLVLKAKKTAYKYEYHWELIKLIEWELKINQYQLYANTDKDEMKIIFRQLFDSIEKIKNEYEYTGVSMDLFININKAGAARSPMEMKKYEAKFNKGLMKDVSNAGSFHAANSFYQLKGHYNFYSNDFKAACNYRNEIVNLYERNPHQITENAGRYTSNLFNMAAILTNLEEYGRVLEIVKKLRAIEIPSGVKKQEIYFQSRVIEIEAYLAMGDFINGSAIAKEFENNLEKIDAGILDQRLRIAVRADIAKVYFGLNKFRMANTWLNKVIRDFKGDVKPDLICITRIIQLIVHYEMKDNDLLEYSVRSTYRYLLKHKRLFKFEDAVLNFIRNKIPIIDTNEKLIIAFRELKIEIEKTFKDPYEKRVLSYFDFTRWLESKIEKRPFAVVVRERARVVIGDR